MAVSWIACPEAFARPKNLVDFSAPNIRVHFRHTTNLATLYNPQAEADRVVIARQNQPLGALLIRPVPHTLTVKDFIESGQTYYKEKWGVARVDYHVFTNPNHLKFHHLRIEVVHRGNAYVLERFIYLQEEIRPPTDKSKKPKRSISKAYSFEFAVLKDAAKQLQPEIKIVIDSFKIDPLPGKSTPAKPTPRRK